MNYKIESGVELIQKERQRQIEECKYLPEQDLAYDFGDLAAAAAVYIMTACGVNNPHKLTVELSGDRGDTRVWQWSQSAYKPESSPLDNLIKAGALIAAEIDRIQTIVHNESEIEKDNIDHYMWETIDTYLYDSLAGYIPVSVQIARGSEGLWYGRTIDDAGGGDDVQLEPIAPNYEEAVKWAKEYAKTYDETPDLGTLAAMIAESEWWETKLSVEKILETADSAVDRQSGSYLWVNKHGFTYWDSASNVRVLLHGDHIRIPADHNSLASALISLRQAVNKQTNEHI